MIREGEGRYTDWKKRNQSLSYVFTQETESLFNGKKVDDLSTAQKVTLQFLKII